MCDDHMSGVPRARACACVFVLCACVRGLHVSRACVARPMGPAGGPLCAGGSLHLFGACVAGARGPVPDKGGSVHPRVAGAGAARLRL